MPERRPEFHSARPRCTARARLLPAAVLITLATGALARTAGAEAGRALGASADSVTRATWTLSNGTRVVAQHIPRGFGISISVGYPGGSDQDPAGRGGLAALLAELEFMSAAGDVPERTRREMTSLRPLGADVHVGECFTLFTEVANRAQFYGVLHQVVTRMRGVQVTPAGVTAALATVRGHYHDQYLGAPDLALYNQMRDRATGLDDAALRQLATVAGLEKLTAKDLAPQVAKAFPSNRAVIAIAGNLDGMDVRAALEHELTGVAGGPPGALPPARRLQPFSLGTTRAGLARPIGGIGIFAPAFTDSTHPAFFLAALIVGAQGNTQWGDPVPPMTSRFQYSVIEDPDLMRLYPPMTLQDRTPEAVAQSFTSTLGRQDNLVVQDDIMEQLRYGVEWLIGGRLNDAVLNHMRTDGLSLILLSTNIAERELRGGEAFWSVYRARAEKVGVPDLVWWLAYMSDPKLEARLVFVPPEATKPAGH